MATTVKNTKIDEQYSHLKAQKPIITLTKFRSPYVIELYEDLIDNWFIFFMTKNKKTSEFTHCSIIIRKDVSIWVSYHNSFNWVVGIDTTDLLKENTKTNTNS